jgi:hypothetical protein
MEKKDENKNPFTPSAENMFSGNDENFLEGIMGTKIQGATAVAKMNANKNSLFFTDNKLN